MTATIEQSQDKYVLTFSKDLINDDFFRRLVEWVEYLNLVQQSQLTEEGAWELSESIKADWWKANRERILEKINQA